MTTELTVLTLAALLQFIQFVLMAIPVNLELGTNKTLSSRDQRKMGGSIQEQVKPQTARLIRALNNHFEALILFGIAVMIITVSEQSSTVTGACAWLYLFARILYVPAYAFDWVPWRSVIWAVSFTATAVMLLSALV